MKRSEMVKVMVNAYSDRVKDQMIYFTKEDAERVLAAMEQVGMQPPFNWRTVDGFKDGHSDEFHYWEPEDKI